MVLEGFLIRDQFSQLVSPPSDPVKSDDQESPLKKYLIANKIIQPLPVSLAGSTARNSFLAISRLK